VFNSLEGLANLVLSILLVRHFGLLGVALGTMVPMAFTKLFVQPWYFCRIMHFDLLEYYTLLAKSFLATALALLLPAALIFRFAAADYKVMAALLVVSILCFVPVLFVLLFTAAERNSIRTALSGFLGSRHARQSVPSLPMEAPQSIEAAQSLEA
jgi:hypothetical protein